MFWEQLEQLEMQETQTKKPTQRQGRAHKMRHCKIIKILFAYL